MTEKPAAAKAPAVPAVFAAIATVQRVAATEGIAKAREVTEGVRFQFRGIDDVLNFFSTPMSDAGMMLLPSYSDLNIDERKTAAGKPNYHVTVVGSFRAISTKDGSELQLGTFIGEANDTADKAVAKAQSIALRQCYLQTFVVPLGAGYDPEDGDSTGASTEAPAKPERQQVPRQVEGEVETREEQQADDGLNESQQKLVKQKLKQKGLTAEDVKKAFGRIHTGNVNNVMRWINNWKPESE